MVDGKRASKAGAWPAGPTVLMWIWDAFSSCSTSSRIPTTPSNRPMCSTTAAGCGLMQRNGWKNLPRNGGITRWSEPYPEQYFDMPVKTETPVCIAR